MKKKLRIRARSMIDDDEDNTETLFWGLMNSWAVSFEKKQFLRKKKCNEDEKKSKLKMRRTWNF